MKVLFLCDHNRMRSPTAERLFAGHPGLEVSSAGIAYTAERQVTQGEIDWADVVFVMEQRQQQIVCERFTAAAAGGKRIINLDIPDHFPFMDPQLVSLLQEKVLGRLAEIETTPPPRA